ncbi:unnamed protein product [Urochloa decumbens]|uniref:Jacalin-type lectin domain-containing protein n=1 Tax=Urochloa decumbens TaxID=240449 RepID=A0ABC9B712_9POAL
MAMENTILVALFLTALVVLSVSVPTATADNIEKKDICSKSLPQRLDYGEETKGKDIPEPLKRLESVTIISNYCINAIKFSYTDQTGQRCSAGPWGGPGGTAHKDLGTVAEEDGTPFSITAPTGTSIMGFFARGERYPETIGVYLNKL